MKIIDIDGDSYIKANDLIEAINSHKETVISNNAIFDDNLSKWYSLAHEHLIFMIEEELKVHKEANNAGDNDNGDYLYNIGDDIMDKQEEVKNDIGYTIFNRRIVNFADSKESNLKKEVTGYGALEIVGLQCLRCRKVCFEIVTQKGSDDLVYRFCPHCGTDWKRNE